MGAAGAIRYRGIPVQLPRRLSTAPLTDPQKQDAVLRKLTEINNITVPDKKLENEVNVLVSQLHSELRYDSLMHGTPHFFIQDEIEARMDDIRAEALHTVKLELILKQIIAQEALSVTKEELEKEAEAISKRQSIPLERIYDFLGDDLKLLTQDLLAQKAIELVAGSAEITYI